MTVKYVANRLQQWLNASEMVRIFRSFLPNIAALLRKRLIGWGLPEWKGIFEAVSILIIIFMPVLNSWGLLLPLLFLLWLCSEGKSNPVVKELAVFWLAMVFSACLSASLKSGIQSLTTYSSWLLITYLSGKTFSVQFSKKLINFLVYSCSLWLGIGLMQQWAGVPTPLGWLGKEQSNLITVRSYSLFGNPNIYALYLLSMLVFSSYLITESADWRKLKICRLLLVLIWIIVLVALYFTYSRFAWVLGIVFLIFWFWDKLGKWRWPILMMAPLLLLALRGFKIRMATLITLTDSSLWYRIRIWQGVLKALPNFWLWGAGPGSFLTIYPWYQIKDTISAHAHQLFLQLWLENGIFSLAAFLWLFRKMALRFMGVPEFTKAIATVIIIFLGYGLTETWVQNRLIGGYFWLFCGLLLSLKDEELVTE
jgi:putative inorganic carbon (hco3(-)) transporter